MQYRVAEQAGLQALYERRQLDPAATDPVRQGRPGQLDASPCIDFLLPMQRQDFADLFEIMSGLPVTIRLLDPPLH